MAIDYRLAGTLKRSPDLGAYYHSHYSDLCYADNVVLAQTIDVISDNCNVMAEETTPFGLSWAKTPRPISV